MTTEIPHTFNRKRIYKEYKERLKSELEAFKNSNLKLEFLKNLLEKNNNHILESKNVEERRTLEIKNDIVHMNIEEILKNIVSYDDLDEYNSYPDISDPAFNLKILEKLEFNKNKIPLSDVDIFSETADKPFIKSPTQKFIKNYLSEYTPYNGTLLWHGVGIGKTCAAISAAENFRGFCIANNTKILILTPSDTLIPTWKNEIFNLDKELKKKNVENVQCTGTRYINEIKEWSGKTYEQLRREVNRIISKYYEFMGYTKLANNIEREMHKLIIGKKYPEKVKIDYIKRNFSNRVIIMDEVHSTRDSETAQDKKARPFIEMICRYADNVKLILTTATPMYNVSKEIIWLLNLLLWNDRKAPLFEDDLFSKDGITLLTYPTDKKPFQYVLETITTKARGYISYLRSQNPFIFPLKLDPTDGYTPNPKYILNKKKLVEIPDKDKIKDMIFYPDHLSPWQYNFLKKYSNIMSDAPVDLDDINDEEEENTHIISSFSSKAQEASNIVFPKSSYLPDGNFDGEIGEIGFKGCFTKSGGKYELSSHIANLNGKPFLHLSNIQEFSAKFYNIIRLITTSQGATFIYSKFITSGVLTLAIALEINGFKRYGEDNISNYRVPPGDRFCSFNNKYYKDLNEEERKNFKQAQYIYITGETPKKTMDEWVSEFNGFGREPNLNGEYIKVILGSRVIEAGINLKRIRETHILDPWFHLNQMEQAAGRSIRTRSHDLLPPEKRNVSLYLHIGALPLKDDVKDYGVETIDERIYRTAFKKKLFMSMIERELKTIAIDCGLNRNGNIFIEKQFRDNKYKPLENRLIVDAHGREFRMDLYDKDYSMMCDFKRCDYKCVPDDKVDKIDTDTFGEQFMDDEVDLAKEFLKQYFLNEYVVSEKEIINNIEKTGVISDRNIIYKALDELVQNREEVKDGYYRPGYILSRFGYYVFQPLEIEDTDIDLFTRIRPVNNKTMSLPAQKYLTDDLLKRTKDRQRFITGQFDTTQKIAPKLKPGEKGEYSKMLVVMEKLKEYVLKQPKYMEYPEKPDPIRPHLPSQDEVVKYLTQSHFDQLNFEKKEILFKNIIPEINDYEKNNKTDKNLFFDYFIEHYDQKFNKDLNYLLLRNKRDYFDRRGIEAPKDTDNRIIGFRLIDPDNNFVYYFENKDTGRIEKDTGIFEKEWHILDIPRDTNLFLKNKSGVYGFIKFKSGVPEFHLVNKEDGTFKPKYNPDGTIQPKTDRKGAKCGTGSATNRSIKDKPELVAFINKLAKYERFTEDTDIIKVRTEHNNDMSLCEDIEILLRHYEHIRIKTNSEPDKRYFYKTEEVQSQN